MFGSNAFGWPYFGQGYAGTSSATVSVGFIGPATAVYSPTLTSSLEIGFISSGTTVYSLTLTFSASPLPDTFTSSGTWTCPPGVTSVRIECYGGGGGGGNSYTFYTGTGGGGGGGAYAERLLVPVTPGTAYTVTVGTGGPGGTTSNSGVGTDGTSSSFTGDSSVQVIAVGGTGSNQQVKGNGGAAASCTGDTGHIFSGGNGGAGTHGASDSGGGGGASGNQLAAGNIGQDGGPSTASGGAGANGGGSGGNSATSGSAPGGGGGGNNEGNPANGSGAGGQVTISPATAGKRGLHVVANVGANPTFTGKRGLHAVANVGANPTFTGKRGLHVVASITRVLVSQVASEALYDTTSAKARVSQAASESLVKIPDLGNRVSQVAVEILLRDRISIPFISASTTVYPLTLTGSLAVPFINPATIVYPLSLATIYLPFISPFTLVFSLYLYNPDLTFSGPGNGGETFGLRLAPSGGGSTATLASSIGSSSPTVHLTGDSGFPTTRNFVVTIDSEVLYLIPRTGGVYGAQRGLSNTTSATHSSGATVTWGDSYDMAILATENVDASFTADINSTGSYTYPGWLICIDSSQAYNAAGDRYPTHVASVLGVFDAGAGSSGSNRTDGAQPNAISTPTGLSDNCPAALSNPARIATDIVAGDVALCRYTNSESYVLDLGPRSTALQSWFGLKRVDTTDHDVTFTNPNGIVVDTTGTYDTFTGSVNDEWGDPIPLLTGIAPDASDTVGHAVPTPSTVPWTTVTLPGADRFFTYGSPGYNETGWPICCLAVRQGNKRVPFWSSWDWHNYGYVYSGFGTDDTYAQLLINRNGIVFDSVPVVELPGPQDIPGPDAVWDDANYYVGASWYVVLFNGPYIVFGPSIGGGQPPIIGGSGGYAPGVIFPGGGGGGPIITTPPTVEGGSGGGIGGSSPGLHVWIHF